MPTYEYQCQKCGKKFDKLQSFKERPLSKCIYCKGKVARLISSGAGRIFKGTGFYITDYKNKSANKPQEKPAKPKPNVDTQKKNDP